MTGQLLDVVVIVALVFELLGVLPGVRVLLLLMYVRHAERRAVTPFSRRYPPVTAVPDGYRPLDTDHDGPAGQPFRGVFRSRGDHPDDLRR